MALEILLPNAISGWPTGAVTDIDEGTDSPNDSDLISSLANGEGDILTIDFASVVNITDADTVTNVTLKVRLRSSIGTNASFDAEFLIGGTPQGLTVSPTNTSSFVTYTVNDTGWNSDWTAAQLNGCQVRITGVQGGMPANEQWDISAAQLEITYTPSSTPTSINATSVSRTNTVNNATVQANVDTNITATNVSRTNTVNNATVALTNNTDITATNVTRTNTANNATVQADVDTNITATSVTRTNTANNATVNLAAGLDDVIIRESLTISSGSRTSNVVTINLSAGNTNGNLQVGDEIVIAGCTPASFNGKHTITGVASQTQFTFAQTDSDESITVAGTAGGDYSSVSAWTTGESRSLTNPHTVELYDDKDWYESSLALTGWTTTATNRITLKAAPNNEYDYFSDTGVFYWADSTGSHALNVNGEFITIQDIHFRSTNYGTIRYVSNANIQRCFIETYSVNCVERFDATCTLFNNIFKKYGAGSSFVAVSCRNWVSGTSFASNNIFVGAFSLGIQDGHSSRTIENNVFVGCTTDVDTTSGGTIDNNATDSATSFGTNCITSISTTNDFVDYAGGDYTPAMGGVLDTAGLDQSGDFTDDLTRLTRRTGTWELGPLRAQYENVVYVRPSNTISSGSRTSNVVTINLSATFSNSNLKVGQKIVIAGCTPTSFNGTHTIASVASQTQFTFAQTGSDESISVAGTAGGDYTSLANAMAVTRNCVAQRRYEVTELFDDFASGDSVSTGNGSDTQDADYYTIVRAHAGEEAALDGSSGARIKQNGTSWSTLFSPGDYTRIKGIIFEHNAASGSLCYSGSTQTTNVLVENCFFKGNPAYTTTEWYHTAIYMASNAEAQGQFRNCVFTDLYTVVTHDRSWRYVYFDNCTVVNCQYGIWHDTTTSTGVVLENCLFDTIGNAIQGTGDLTNWSVNYCASTDVTMDDAGGTGNRISQTFTFNDAANDDFTLAETDTGARGHGNSMASQYTTDFTGLAWTDADYNDWDIGAFRADHTVVRTVKASLGDYTSITAFTNGADAEDMLTQRRNWQLDIYDGDYTSAGGGNHYLQENPATWSSSWAWDTTGKYHLHITCPDTEYHGGAWGGGVWINILGSWTTWFNFQVKSIKLSKLEINCTTGQDGLNCINGAGYRVEIDRCMFTGDNNYQSGVIHLHSDAMSAGRKATLKNTVIRDATMGNGFAVTCYPWNGTGNLIENCTICASNYGISTISSGNTYTIVKNCVIYNSTGDRYSGNYFDTTNSTNNAADNGSTVTPPGVNPITTDIVSGDFVDAANDDYTPVASGTLAGAGATLSSNVIDITGVARPQGTAYEIGAYEIDEDVGTAITATSVTRTNTVNNATVEIGTPTNITATSVSRTNTVNNATVQADVDTNISATSATRTNTANNATVQADVDINISATAATRTNTAQNAVVTLDNAISISATSVSRTNTANNAIVQADVDLTISATSASRTNTVHGATVQADVDTNITATSVAKTNTAYNATIQADVDTNISATSVSRTNAAQNATVQADTDINISATSASRTNAAQNATLQVGNNVNIGATSVSRTNTSNNATVQADTDINISATSVSRTNAAQSATVQADTDTNISATSVSRTNTIHGATVQANVDTNVIALSVARTNATYNGTVQADVDTHIGATSVSRTNSTLASVVKLSQYINATSVSRTNSPQNAVVVGSVPSTGTGVSMDTGPGMIEILRNETALPLQLSVSDGGGITGLTVTAKIRDGANPSSYLDFDDATFKTSAWVQQSITVAEVGNGFYAEEYDISSVTNLPTTNFLIVEYSVTGSENGIALGIVKFNDTWKDPLALTVGKFIGLK